MLINCIKCGKEFIRKGRKKYCTKCANEVYREGQVKYRASKK